MAHDPSDADTTAPEVGEGIARAMQAREVPAGAALVAWLVRYPEHAGTVARFLDSDQRALQEFCPPAKPARTGAVLGGYEVGEEIGHGAMGVVYRAFDPVLKRAVALKVVRTEGLPPAELARVRFEAEAMGELNDPNVVRVFASGETKSELYFALELLPQNLAEHLKALGPNRLYTPDAAAKLVGAVALGVHHAHQRGILHRDLKPGNILLDADGVPRVADFGLARRVDIDASVSGRVAGTPAYMAPEQARGEKHLTTAADVWALGAVLFELLTGAVPFRGDVGTVLRKLADPHESVPPVSAYRSDVPADLEAVCMKCLERAPERRYASAQELADDLGRFLRREPILARPRGLLGDLFGALNKEQETPSMTTWRGFAFGVVNHILTHGLVAALLYAGHPRAALAAVVFHLFTWIGAIWWFAIRRRTELNAIERFGVAFSIGSIIAVALTVPLAAAGPAPNVALIYLVYNAAIGVGSFSSGFTHRGRHYLLGLIWLAQNAVLPFLPPWAWPALHALVGSAIQAWVALAFRRAHLAGLAKLRD